MTPIVSNQMPAVGASGVALGTTITFDVIDPSTGINAAATNITLDRGGTVENVMLAGVQQAGYTVVVTPITYGFNYLITPTTQFNNDEIETVTIYAEDNSTYSTTVFWAFMTVAASSFHSKPHIINEFPFNTATNIPTNSHIIFTVKSDDVTTPANSILPNSTIKLNGVTIISGGTNILPGQYSVSTTPGTRTLTFDITPIAGLPTDTVFTLSGTFEDDVGNIGSDQYQFSTGLNQFAMQLDRTEPLLCPIDNIPDPIFTSRSDVQITPFSDLITSYTMDWARSGLAAYDAIEITDGPDAGRWLVRTPSLNQARLYHIFTDQSTERQAKGYIRREFADRNPIILTFSGLFDYKLLKVWGDTQLRYLAGYPSDSRFPVAWHSVPVAAFNDSTFRLNGAVSAANGSATVTGVGTSFDTDLTPLDSYVTIGHTVEKYQVTTPISPTTLTISPPFIYRERMTGTVSISLGGSTLTGVGTKFVAELVNNQKFQIENDPTVYTVLTITNDTSLSIVGTAAQASTAQQCDIVSVVNQTIHKLDNSNGAVFDDQTNSRLDFKIFCNPPPTPDSDPTPRWDRYSIPLAASVRPVLTDTAVLTNASATVVMSGTSYRTELHVGAVVTFDANSTQYTVVDIDNTLQQITISPAWGSTSAVNQTVQRKIDGTRSMTVFRVTQMDELTDFFIGLNNSTGSPLSDGENVVGVSFVRDNADKLVMRGHLGSSFTLHHTQMSVADFVGRDWVLEIEMLDNKTMQARLLDFDDLQSGDVNRTLQVQNSALPATSPIIGRWTVTTLSTGGADPNRKVVGYVNYADVEPGQGLPFSLGTNFVESTTAKPRLIRNRLNIPLAGSNGWKILNVKAGTLASSFTGTQYDRIFWDTDEVVVVIDQFEVHGGVTSVIPGPDRTVKKFSLKHGFDQITMQFRASRRGYWYVIIDGNDPVNGIVAARGVYDVADALQSVTIDGQEFYNLSDGLHTLNVVICKEPVPSSWSMLPGIATLNAKPNLLKSTGTALFGLATLTADASVLVGNEEDSMVLENLSAQVAGGGGTQTLFTTSQPYKPNKLWVWLDGVEQNFNPTPTRVVETNNTLGTFTLDSPPRVTQRLVVSYVPL